MPRKLLLSVLPVLLLFFLGSLAVAESPRGERIPRYRSTHISTAEQNEYLTSSTADVKSSKLPIPLPLLIADPAGDGGDNDVIGLYGEASSGILHLVLELNSIIDPTIADFDGQIFVDADQDPSTGSHDLSNIGAEYVFLYYYWGPDFICIVLDIRLGFAIFIGEYALTYAGPTLAFDIPLADLGGDDGNMNFAGVLYDINQDTHDYFPDSADPLNLVLPLIAEDNPEDSGENPSRDIYRLYGDVCDNSFRLRLEMADDIAEVELWFDADFGLDVDQNPLTGDNGWGDIGSEYNLYIYWGEGSWLVELYQTPSGVFVGSYDALQSGPYMQTVIPMSDLGDDDGNMDIAGQIWLVDIIDYIPDAGHATMAPCSGFDCADEMVTGIPENECLDLVALYNATNGDSWDDNTNWLTAAAADDWYGVVVTDGHVQHLFLDINNLTGTLPQLANLPFLQTFYLSENGLIGPIPDFQLPVLEGLYLDVNGLTGAIPDFSGMPNLGWLYVDDNQLTGAIPSFTNTPNLRSFECDYNLLEDIPDLTHLTQLVSLYIDQNNLGNDDCPNVQLLIDRGGWNNLSHSPQNDWFTFPDDCLETQIIDLVHRWNWISSYLDIFDPDVANIWALYDCLSIMEGYNGFYLPEQDVNMLGNWAYPEMYKAHLSCPDPADLVLTGHKIDPATTPISLNPGWNWIAYYPTTEMSPSVALASIMDYLLYADGYYGFFIPGLVDFLTMRPGEGYRVFVTQACDLYYPAAVQQPLTAQHHNESPGERELNPLTSHTQFFTYHESHHYYPVLLSESAGREFSLNAGDEIGAFANDDGEWICIGASVWTGEEPLPILAWADDPQTDIKDGYEIGEAITLRHWRAETGTQLDLPLVFANGADTYEAGLYSLACIDSEQLGVDGTDNALITEFKLEQNYPNPFNPLTLIGYQLPVETPVKLRIYNTGGQLIRNLVDSQQGAGRYTITWDGRNDLGHEAASGVYLYVLETATEKVTKQMTLLR